MSRQQHEQVAKDWFDALGHADTARMAALSTDDLTWWIMPGNKFSGTHVKEPYLAAMRNLLDDASGPLTFEYEEITGEDDRLAVAARGDLPMKDGRHYRNYYHFLLHFRDGKVASGKEYMDSAHVNEIFGAP